VRRLRSLRCRMPGRLHSDAGRAGCIGQALCDFFRINFSGAFFCGFCEEACPTYAIQLTPDFEMGEWKRHSLVYEKEDLLISGPASTMTIISTASRVWR